MSYNSNLPADTTAPSEIRGNFRALKEDKIVDAATAVTADSATKLTTARVISLTGDATGSATFDGSADVAIAVDVLTADSVAWENVSGKPSAFTPPVATADTLGGIKQGTGLSIASDGTASVTGYLPLAGGAMTGAINETAVTMASATTMNIGAAAGNLILVTGTNTIGAFDTVQAGTRRKLRFANSLTISHSDSAIVLPGGVSFIVVTGDVLEFTSLGGGVWTLSDYQPMNIPSTMGSLRGIRGIIETTTLTASDCGVLLHCYGSALTVTLPSAASLPAGACLHFWQSDGNSTTLSRAGTDVISGGGTLYTSITITPRNTLVVMSDGNNHWYIVGGSYQNVYSGLFESSLTGVGYQKLPSGLIIQWGAVNGSTSGAITVTFPIAFSNGVLQLIPTVQGGTYIITSISLSGFTVEVKDLSLAYANQNMRFIAIGY